MARKVHLHQRDLEILAALVERRVESLQWLHETYWRDNELKTARNRLGELARAGYLRRVSRSLSDRAPGERGRQRLEHFWLLGPKARAALRTRGMAGHELTAAQVRAGVAAALIDHQIAVNRVGDWLGAKMVPERQLAMVGRARRHRPDAAYRAREADEIGRDLVLVEVDLGHYSRQRILAKVATFLAAKHASAIVIAAPTEQRCSEIARWIREHYGTDVMERIQVFDFPTLRAGAPLDPCSVPAPDLRDPALVAEKWRQLL